MDDWKRQSPVKFEAKPAKTEARGDWVVTLAYEDEGPGPWLVDLCHKPRWDLQDGRLDGHTPAGVDMPLEPGDCRLKDRTLLIRMNRTQAALWHLGPAKAPELPPDTGYTDVSEATAFLALLGPEIFSLAERLTPLDFKNSNRPMPFLLQGPFSHVPCRLAAFAGETEGAGAILLTCSRGYAGDMVQAILAAGRSHGIRPAGEDRFTTWLDTLEALDCGF